MILDGKVVIVTGVGPGMGCKLSVGAAGQGARVVMAARNTAFLQQVQDEISSAGGDCLAVPTDVSVMYDCTRVAAEAIEKYGRIDGLVNSAYYYPQWGSFETANLADWARAYDVACMGALRMVRAVLPQMKQQRSGAIVNISTLATRKPVNGEGGYAIAKSALSQATRQLAIELGGYGIRVNQALMGWMMGVPVQGYIDRVVEAGGNREAVVGEIVARIPLGRIPPDQDCAKAVMFLLSDFSSEVTGAALEVNGGEWVAP